MQALGMQSLNFQNFKISKPEFFKQFFHENCTEEKEEEEEEEELGLANRMKNIQVENVFFRTCSYFCVALLCL